MDPAICSAFANMVRASNIAAVPMPLRAFSRRVEDLLRRMRAEADGKLIVEKLDPAPDSDAEDAALLAMRLVNAMRAPFQVDGVTFSLGTSLGIAIYPDDGATADELMISADKAMYAQKRSRYGALTR